MKNQIDAKADRLAAWGGTQTPVYTPEGERLLFSLHLLFLGETGRDAPAAAQYAAREYRSRGLLPTDRVTTMYMPELLQRQATGAGSFSDIARGAAGGVLLIRDFHALSRIAVQANAVTQTLNALLQVLKENENSLCVILEGYAEDVCWLLRQNDALCRRFPHKILFDAPAAGRLWRYRVCRCCGKTLNGDDCAFCGLENARELNDRFLTPEYARVNAHRRAAIARVGDICIAAHDAAWDEKEGCFLFLSKRRVKLAAAADCAGRLMWSDEAFAQSPEEFLAPVQVELLFSLDGKEERRAVTLEGKRSGDFWRLGVRIDGDFTLRLCLGTPEDYTESAPIPLFDTARTPPAGAAG